MPQLAEYLNGVADRIERREATRKDAEGLRRLAQQAAGKDAEWTIKVHGAHGRPRLGAHGVDQKVEMAKAIKAYKEKHGCTLAQAYEDLDGKLHMAGRETLKKAWQRFGPLLDANQENFEFIVYMERLAAKGLATVTRRKG
ncbi:hypothetical protein ACUXST_001690 [Sphingomonas sp. F9_3S_D5_B_2]